jgi:hypothetical protein
MRRQLLLFVLAAGATACAARAPRITTPNITYSCDNERQVHRDNGRVLSTSGTAQLALGWRDGEGEHFVSWPTSSTQMEAVEYVMPPDARADAIERVYDTSKGSSRVDWRMVRSTACTATGGYSDALARFATGKSFDQVAQELSLGDKNEARELVHHALVSVQKRYFREH